MRRWVAFRLTDNILQDWAVGQALGQGEVREVLASPLKTAFRSTYVRPSISETAAPAAAERPGEPDPEKAATTGISATWLSPGWTLS